jgi:hypothetical protein
MVEEKLILTIQHDLRQLERPMGTSIHIYMHQKSGLHGLKITLSGARKIAKRVLGITDHRHVRGGGDQLYRGHYDAKTPFDGQREVRSCIATKTIGTVGRVGCGAAKVAMQRWGGEGGIWGWGGQVWQLCGLLEGSTRTQGHQGFLPDRKSTPNFVLRMRENGPVHGVCSICGSPMGLSIGPPGQKHTTPVRLRDTVEGALTQTQSLARCYAQVNRSPP